MICIKCKQVIPDHSLFCNLCGVKQTKPAHQPKQRGNGQGTVIKLPNGKYKAIVTVNCSPGEDGKLKLKRKCKTFERKKDAVAYLPMLRMEPPKAKKITLLDLHKIWLDKKQPSLSKSKITHYKTAWERLKDLWYRDITNLTLEEMQTAVDAAPGTYYPKRDIKVLLSQLYKIGLKHEYVEKNRAEYVDLPDNPKSDKDAFTKVEREAIWKDYNDGNKFTSYILILIYTGMRIGELYQLQRENIHLDERYMIGGIKSEAGIDRQIPIAEEIVPILEERLADAKFVNVRLEEFYEQYPAALARAQVRPLNPHCCRHTCATVLAETGVQPAIIKEILGHAKYETTLGYTHIPISAKIEAINKIVGNNRVTITEN